MMRLGRISRFNRSMAVLAAVGFLCAGFEYQPSFEKVAGDAQMALDTNRLDAAHELYRQAAELAPERIPEISLDWAWTYVQKGFYSLKGGAPEEAGGHFARAVEIHPEVKADISDIWTVTRMNVFHRRATAAKEDPDNTDWQALLDYARETAALVGERPHTHFALAVALEGAGDAKGAAGQYALAIRSVGKDAPAKGDLRAAALQALAENKISITLPIHPLWRKIDEGEFQKLEMPPFTVYHHNAEVARRIGQSLRYFRSERVLSGLLGPNDHLPRDCSVYLHRDGREFLQATGMPAWSGAAARLLRRGGRIAAGEIHLYQTMPMIFENSCPHELAHLRFAANPSAHGGVPLWIHEGVATAAENDFNREWMHRVLTRARDADRLIPVRDMLLLKRVPGEGFEDIFYAESHAMLAKLVERFGAGAVWRFIRILNSRGQEKTLAQFFKLRPMDLENMVLEWIKEGDDELLEKAQNQP